MSWSREKLRLVPPEGRTGWVVGTDEVGRRKLSRVLNRLRFRVVGYRSADDLALALERNEPVSVIFFEVRSDKPEDFSSLTETLWRSWPAPVITVSATPDPATIVRAVKLGAADHLVRPFSDSDLERAVNTAIERLFEPDVEQWCEGCGTRQECSLENRNSALLQLLSSNTLDHPLKGRALKENEYPFIIASPTMQAIDKLAHQLADSDLTVLIRGESGAGKEVVARHIHRCSTRCYAPFVKVNCAAVPSTLLESELFGYEKGAFTGADSRKLGKFELAHRGTIMLDEISELSSHLQAKLLHVLQDMRFTRLGANDTIRVDARVLVATNKNLEHLVDEGIFREDLYFRLKVIDLYVPPLRERREEIPLLADYFLCRFARQYRRKAPALSEELFTLMLNHQWRGNVRELENAIKRIVVLGEESAVLQELQPKVNGAPSPPPQGGCGPARELSLKRVGQRAALVAERDLILSTLQHTRWNRRKASELLGVSYKTLRNKIKEYGLPAL